MTVWFEDDDPCYLEWLADHPDAYVLSTTVQPTARHLVLHRATCPRISRPLPDVAGTIPRFGKACAQTPDELRAWALEVTGGMPRNCGLCGGGGD